MSDFWMATISGVALAALIAGFCYAFFRIGRNVGHREAWRVVVTSVGKKLKTPFGTVKVEAVEKVSFSREFGKSVYEMRRTEEELKRDGLRMLDEAKAEMVSEMARLRERLKWNGKA